MTESDIRSWYWQWPGVPMGQHYKVTTCALSQVGSRADLTLDIARM